MEQITSTSTPVSSSSKYSAVKRIIGALIIIVSVFTLFVTFDTANSPYTSQGGEDYLAGDITGFWGNFSYMGILLLVGMILFFQNKVKVWILILVELGLFVALFASSIIGTYNTITFLDQQIQRQLGDIKVYYQLRSDVVTDLLSVAREPLAQEKDIQMKLAEARSSFSQGDSKNSIIESANKFEQALGRIVVTMEAYPALRDTKEFQNVQNAISETGINLATERVKYNQNVSNYNIMTKSFPMSLFAKSMNFDSYEYWSEITK